MLENLITSKTRIKLLIKFFINANTTAYLRNLSAEFNESTNAIRQELNRFEKANLLETEVLKNKKIYRANTHHPYYNEIHKLLLKYTGIDQIINNLIARIGFLDKAFIINDFAQGKPSNTIDLILVGRDFDQEFLHKLVKKAEETVSFKIKYITVSPDEAHKYVPDNSNAMLVWDNVNTNGHKNYSKKIENKNRT